MRIGNRNLNENEAEWCQKKSEEILTQATLDISSAINIAKDEKAIAGLLSYLWTNNVEPEPFTEDPVEDDNGDDIE